MKVTRKSHDATTLFYHSSELSSFWYSSSGSFCFAAASSPAAISSMCCFWYERISQCPQLISYSLLCKWFRAAVLPLDKLLFAELYQSEDKRRCSVCGAAFASTSNNVKYCPDCRKYITRRQAAERMRKKRALVTK